MSTDHSDKYGKVERKMIEDINVVGWSVVMIEATGYLPSFAYTIGLWKNYQHPEIIAFGLTVKTLHLVLNDAGDIVKKGRHYETNKVYSDLFTNGYAQFVPVDKRSFKDYLGYAIWHNEGLDFPALELVWTDRNNRFPWDIGYEEEFQYRQPLLDRNAEFKYREQRDLGVFTTTQWLEEKKPIVRVIHDEDGNWHFLTGDQMPEDIRLVRLHEMVSSDLTLNDVFHLDYGTSAERTGIGRDWVRQPVNFDGSNDNDP